MIDLDYLFITTGNDRAERSRTGYATFLRSELFHRYLTVRFVYHGKKQSWPVTLEVKHLFIGGTASHICGQKRNGRWQR